MRPGPQSRLPVREIAAAQLVVARARDARVATGAGDADLAAGHAVQDVLARTCEAFRWGHDVFPPIDFAVSGSRMRVASLLCRKLRLSTSNVGTTG